MAVEAKICGLTRPGDAALAAPAWRRLPRRRLRREHPAGRSGHGARDREGAAGGVPVVGVFVSHPVDEILRLRDAAGLSAVQLHGAVRRRGRGGGCGARSCRSWAVQHIAGPDDLERLADAGGRRRCGHDRAAGARARWGARAWHSTCRSPQAARARVGAGAHGAGRRAPPGHARARDCPRIVPTSLM